MCVLEVDSSAINAVDESECKVVVVGCVRDVVEAVSCFADVDDATDVVSCGVVKVD